MIDPKALFEPLMPLEIRTRFSLSCHWKRLPFSWPLRIMCMSSIPARVMAADQNDLKPSIGRVSRLIARWSCSTTLFRYFTWRSSMLASLSVLHSSIAAVLAPLFVDGDLPRRAALVNGLAKEAGSGLAVPLGSEEEVNSVPRVVDGSMEGRPLTLMYVSSMRQL